MKPFIKICGITNLDDALLCARNGADALGFIFYKNSPRYIDPIKASKIINQLPNDSDYGASGNHRSSSIIPVGVFVNENRNTIEQIITETKIRIIQLSGDESPEDCSGYGIDVWKVFRLRNQNVHDTMNRYKIAAALLDGADGVQYGGSGKLADHSIALEMKKYHRLIIAGGLNPENIRYLIERVQPFGVDVNSGVESNPGIKDHNKVNQLFKQLQAPG